MLAEPSNDTPPIVLAICNVVAVLALPVKGPTNDVAVTSPALEIFAFDTPPVCKSINNDAVLLVVSVTLPFINVNIVAALFHV